MRKLFILVCIVALSLVAKSQSIKMKITGVTAAGGEEVLAFETSDTTSAPSNYNGGASSGVSGFEFIKIKKLKDASTNQLYRNSIAGTHMADVTFEFYDNNAALFYQVSIKDATVNHFSYLSPECAGCSKLYHQLWFDYKQIEVTDVSTGNVTRYNRATKVFY